MNRIPLPPQKAARRFFFRSYRKLLFFLSKSLLWGWNLFLLFITFLYLSSYVVSLPQEWRNKTIQSLEIVDREGKFLHEEPSALGLFGISFSKQKLPPNVVIATLSAEDHRLMNHQGVDWFAMIRALVSQILPWQKESGGSTLAMQCIRQMRPSKRTYVNKVIEMFWATHLQYQLTPRGVLREYLHRAPYGNRIVGFQKASWVYFGKPAKDLSIAESSFIAALPWGPTLLNPFRKQGKRRAWKRAKKILKRALSLGWISKKDYRDALQDPIRILRKNKRELSTIHWTSQIATLWKKERTSPFFRDVRTIKTTLDLEIQNKVLQVMKKRIKQLQSADVHQASFLALDHQTGEVLVYIPSLDYHHSGNRGAIDYIQTFRSSGSTLKPFLYALGMQKRKLTGASLFSDVATTFFWKNGSYTPINFDFKFMGISRVRVALANSRNIPAVQVLLQNGIEESVSFLESIGISFQNKIHGASLALGSGEVRLWDLVHAYAWLAREGKKLKRTIWSKERILHSSLRLVSKNPPALFASSATSRKHPFQKDILRVMNDILSDPFARLPTFERSELLEPDFSFAYKTGTSQGFRDAWMIGYNSRFVVGCWFGNHDQRKSKRITGHKACSKVLGKGINWLVEKYQPTKVSPFSLPKTWKKQKICALSGKLPTPECPHLLEEWFPPTHKRTKCSFHKKIHIDRRNGLIATSTCPKDFVTTRNVVSLPKGYEVWGQMMSLNLLPNRKSPLCPQQGKKEKIFLRILHPKDRARFLYDASVPKSFSTVGLQVEVEGNVQEVLWFVNGYQVAKKGWPYTARFSIKPGKYEIIATTSDRLIHSKPVTIWVR